MRTPHSSRGIAGPQATGARTARAPLAQVYLHNAAPHTQLLSLLTAAPDSLGVSALHLVALVADAGGAPMAMRHMRLLPALRRRRVPVAKPVADCTRIALLEAHLGAEETHEVGAAPVDGVPLVEPTSS